MALSKIQSESVNLADDFAFSGTVTGAGVSGKVLQVLHFVSTSEKSTTSTSFVASGLFLDITPSATNSKIYAFMEFTMGTSANGPPEYKIYRDSTGIGGGTKFQADANWNNSLDRGSLTKLDSPNTTSSTRYELYFRRTGTGAARIGRNHDGFVTNNATSITLMEIAG